MWTSGRIGNALHFDGTNDYVNVPHTAALNLTGDMTISFWARHNTAGDGETIITKECTGSPCNAPWGVNIKNTGTPNYQYAHHTSGGDYTSYLTFPNYAIPANTWHHVTLTRTSSSKTVSLYVNGAKVQDRTWGTDNPAGNTEAVKMAIGSGYLLPGRNLNGTLDDVRIYNRVLAQTEITGLANPASPLTSVLLNAGGPSYTATDGAYIADAYFSGGSTGGTANPIANTTDDAPYQSERYGAGTTLSYAIPMGNGSYDLTLKFAEIWFSSAGQRIFDVLVEGVERITNLDIFQAAGGKDIAHDITIPVTVSDGTLNINFRTDADAAKVSAIKVMPAATPTPTPPPPTPTPPPSSVSCHLYTPTSTIPSGYGVPWDVFSANELLIKATCQNLTDATLDFGRGLSTQYIYNTGYHYHAGLSGWMPMTLTSTEALISGAWYSRTANAMLTGMDLQNTTHYALGYLCTWTGSQWQCGCRDSACTQSYWQIQSFKR